MSQLEPPDQGMSGWYLGLMSLLCPKQPLCWPKAPCEAVARPGLVPEGR